MRKFFLATAIVATFLMVLGLASAQAATLLVNDATGGNCSDIGVWDDLTDTCTMTGDTTEQITIKASGNGLTLDCDGSTIDRANTVSLVGIVVKSADFITVKNCTVINSNLGISFGTVTNSIVRDNTIQLGSQSVAGGIILRFSSFNTIRDNTLNNNANGIVVELSSDNNTIRDNVLDGSFSTAENVITVTSFGSVDNVVLGNTVRNTSIGITVGSGADRTIVARNVVDGATSIGINVGADHDGVQVLRNNVMNVAGSGINVAASALNTLVKGNVINGAQSGIGMGGASEGTIVIKNTIRNTATGISVFGINHTFRANDVDGATGHALLISSAVSGLIFEKGNKFCNSGSFDIFDGGTEQTWEKTTCDTIASALGNAVCTKVCK